MSLLLLFKKWRPRFRGGGGRMLSVGKARKLAERSRKIIEQKRLKRREWEEPVRAFMSEVRRETKRAPETPEQTIEITPYMVAALSEVFAPKREEVSLARLEDMLREAMAAEDSRAEQERRRALALELLWLVTESQRQEDEELWLLAMAAASI